MNRSTRRGFLGALAGSAASIPLLFLSTAGGPEFAVAIVAGSMPQYVKDTPSSRVLLVGSSYDAVDRHFRWFQHCNSPGQMTNSEPCSADDRTPPRAAAPIGPRLV